MKKLLLRIGVFAVCVLLFADSVAAQEFDYNRAYSDYVYNYNLYRKAHSDYVLARSAFLQGQTLALREKAQEATAKMLQARDEVVRTYLTAVRLKLAETEGIEVGDRETQYGLLDTEVAWYQSHRDKVSSASSIEDLVKDSNQAGSRYQSTELPIYRSLVMISQGKVNFFQERMENVLDEIKVKVAQIRQAGDKDVSAIERWILDVENRIQRSKDKELEALTVVNGLKSSDRNKTSAYKTAILKLAESQQYLKEANSFVLQIINEIKTQDE